MVCMCVEEGMYIYIYIYVCVYTEAMCCVVISLEGCAVQVDVATQCSVQHVMNRIVPLSKVRIFGVCR